MPDPLIDNEQVNQEVLLVYCNVPDSVVANRIANQLIADRRAACVNIREGVQSIYIWGGQVRSEEEVTLAIKTTRQNYAELEKAVLGMHPYEVPELIAIPIKIGSQKYLEWVEGSIK